MATKNRYSDPPDPPTPEDDAPAPVAEKLPDVLVENRRQGIIGGSYSRPTPNQAPGGVTQHDVDQLFLHPGLNFVPADRWALHRHGLRHRIAKSEVVEISDFKEVRESNALAAILETGELPVLRRLLADEERQTVVAALEKAIANAESGGVVLRRANAAHSVL